MKTQIDFYPAVMVGHFNKITSNLDSPEYRFWGENSPFKYDKLLYSFYYLQDRYKKIDGSYFKHIKYDGKIMLDSGGFQVKTLGVKIEPEDVIKIYELENPNIGIILDSPLSTSGWNEESVKWTYKNIKYMISNKHRIKKTELLNVLQGVSIEERKRYYGIMKEFNSNLDGWASASPKRLSPIYEAWSFLYLYENDKTLKDKRIHFLGLTGNRKMAVVYYLAKLGLVKSISFDSTKYGREGIMADMRNPAYMNERLSISKMAKGNLLSNKFCPCPVCQFIPIERMKNDVNFCILHNLFWEIKKFEFLEAFETAEGLKRYIFEMPCFYDDTRVAIKFIDYALKNGLSKAEIAFKPYFNYIPTNKKQSLDGFI